MYVSVFRDWDRSILFAFAAGVVVGLGVGLLLRWFAGG